MIPATEVPHIPLQLAQGCIVASIQIDFTEAVIAQFRQDLLNYLQETGAKGIILDLSGVKVMDLEDFNALNTILSMTAMMGAINILTGLQPGVVSTLIDFNAEIDHLNATLDLDAAFTLIQQLISERYMLLNDEDLESSSVETLEENESGYEFADSNSSLGASGI